MIGSYELTVALLSVAFSLGGVVVCLCQKSFRRYLFLNLYLLFSIAFTLGCLYFIRTAGYESRIYFYFYYTGDALFNILGYLLIASFFDHMFRQSVFRPYVRPTLAIFFVLVVAVSALFVLHNYSQLYGRFVIELQQNMFFVGVLLTFLLWISMSYLQAESRRFVLLISGLGIYFSAHAANYAMRFLFRGADMTTILTKVPPLAYTFMVLLWLYTFWRVPEGEPMVEPAGQPQARESLVKVQISRE